MYRLWGKIIKNNKIISDHMFELDSENISVDERLKHGLETLCYHLDIQKPIWMSDNTKWLNQIGKTRFTNHSFIEEIDFDYFEIEIIENEE